MVERVRQQGVPVPPRARQRHGPHRPRPGGPDVLHHRLPGVRTAGGHRHERRAVRHGRAGHLPRSHPHGPVVVLRVRVDGAREGARRVDPACGGRGGCAGKEQLGEAAKVLSQVQRVEARAVPPLLGVRAVRAEDGSPLRLGRQLRRGVQLQVLPPLPPLHIRRHHLRRRGTPRSVRRLLQGPRGVQSRRGGRRFK